MLKSPQPTEDLQKVYSRRRAEGAQGRTKHPCPEGREENQHGCSRRKGSERQPRPQSLRDRQASGSETDFTVCVMGASGENGPWGCENEHRRQLGGYTESSR